MRKADKNVRILMLLAAVVALMAALAYASVPLYTLFCRATGLGGTTQRGTVQTPHSLERQIRVSFDGNVDPSLPWDFKPVTRSVDLKIGETATIHYTVHNRSDHVTTGTAVYNVQPSKTGLYFNKIQCFCFTEQTLKAGETVDLPVQFYVDPAIAEDRNENDVTNITLSYTFYSAKNQPAKTVPPQSP